MAKKKPAWDIEDERRQGEHFALRASAMDEMGMTKQAEMFQELVRLSDRKIEIFKEIENFQAFIVHIEDDPVARRIFLDSLDWGRAGDK